MLRWELDQAVRCGANQVLPHSATALRADLYARQSDRESKGKAAQNAGKPIAPYRQCIPLTLIVPITT